MVGPKILGKTDVFAMFNFLIFQGLVFSCPEGFVRIPGSQPIQFDLEKLFLLAVSKENLILYKKNREKRTL